MRDAHDFIHRNQDRRLRLARVITNVRPWHRPGEVHHAALAGNREQQESVLRI